MKTNRLLRWLFQRGKPKTVSPAMSAYLLMERRRATIEPEMDISEQPTLILGRVDPAAPTVAVPAEPHWFYADETTAVPSGKVDQYATRAMEVVLK